MELDVFDTAGKVVSKVTLHDSVFNVTCDESLIHQVLTSFLANARQGTRAQKTRAEVSHSTKKLYRQKGTGRARAGMSSSPLRRGGGRIFPNRPDENFNHKINRKMYRKAMAATLTRLLMEERIVVVDSLDMESHKTKGFVDIMKHFSITGSVLFITDELTENLYLATRNVKDTLILEHHQLDIYNLIRCNKTFFVKNAILNVQERLCQ